MSYIHSTVNLICVFLYSLYIFPLGFRIRKYNIGKSQSKFYLFQFFISCYFKYLYIIKFTPRENRFDYPQFREKFNLNSHPYRTKRGKFWKKLSYPDTTIPEKKSIQIWTVKGDCEFPFYIFLKSKKNYNKIIPCIWGFIGLMVIQGIKLLVYLLLW